MLAALLSGLPVGPNSFKGNKAPRIGLCRTPWWSEASPSVQQSLLQCAEQFRKAGATVSEIELPPEFTQLNEVQIRLSAYEFFRALSHERIRHPQLISASLTQRIAAGGQVTRQQYEAAVALTKRCQRWMEALMSGYELLMAPSAPGEAPDIAGTGEPTFGLMWTLLQMPCMTLPCGFGQSGLPVGVQLIAAGGNDIGLYRDAAWAEAQLSAR
jgi:Asp-tRNA(Asn)/Glu-tRNA(Gln) amidotransferase A subunit family amidase